jgi:hypothetical protein
MFHGLDFFIFLSAAFFAFSIIFSLPCPPYMSLKQSAKGELRYKLQHIVKTDSNKQSFSSKIFGPTYIAACIQAHINKRSNPKACKRVAIFHFSREDEF